MFIIFGIMGFEKVEFDEKYVLEIGQFEEIDQFAIDDYHLGIDLMMENAGYHLARVIASECESDSRILIGIGNGNNGHNQIVWRLAC